MEANIPLSCASSHRAQRAAGEPGEKGQNDARSLAQLALRQKNPQPSPISVARPTFVGQSGSQRLLATNSNRLERRACRPVYRDTCAAHRWYRPPLGHRDVPSVHLRCHWPPFPAGSSVACSNVINRAVAQSPPTGCREDKQCKPYQPMATDDGGTFRGREALAPRPHRFDHPRAPDHPRFPPHSSRIRTKKTGSTSWRPFPEFRAGQSLGDPIRSPQSTLAPRGQEPPGQGSPGRTLVQASVTASQCTRALPGR